MQQIAVVAQGPEDAAKGCLADRRYVRFRTSETTVSPPFKVRGEPTSGIQEVGFARLEQARQMIGDEADARHPGEVAANQHPDLAA